jgi:broad specificity phosphatase PhoE
VPLFKLQRLYPALWLQNMAQTDPNFRWPHGESYRSFRSRILRAVAAIARRHPGGRIVLVTHAGVITQILGALSGFGPSRWSVFVAGNASISTVLWTGRTGRLLTFNDRTHLQGLSPPDRVCPPNHTQLVMSGA